MAEKTKTGNEVLQMIAESLPLLLLDIVELTGHNLEARGRVEVHRVLEAGWRLLLIDQRKYHEDNVWRERPMAILGRSRGVQTDTPPKLATF